MDQNKPSPAEELAAWIERSYPDLKEHMQVVTKDSYGKLLHISKDNNIPVFKPFVSTRVAETTDRRVPRICTAPSLAACFLGYYGDWWDFEVGTEEDKDFLGGYIVYGFDSDVAIKPSTKLVCDVVQTNEHWLVGYNEATAEYIPKQLGKVFHMQISLRRVPGEQPTLRRDITTYIEVFDDCMFAWDNITMLTPGYYCIYTLGLMHSQAWNLLNPHSVQKLTQEEYERGKSLTASLLGYIPPVASLRW